LFDVIEVSEMGKGISTSFFFILRFCGNPSGKTFFLAFEVRGIIQ